MAVSTLLVSIVVPASNEAAGFERFHTSPAAVPSKPLAVAQDTYNVYLSQIRAEMPTRPLYAIDNRVSGW